jgi:hypothetical protein
MNDYRVTIEYIDGDTETTWAEAHNEGMACMIVGMYLGYGGMSIKDIGEFIKSVHAVIETN